MLAMLPCAQEQPSNRNTLFTLILQGEHVHHLLGPPSNATSQFPSVLRAGAGHLAAGQLQEWEPRQQRHRHARHHRLGLPEGWGGGCGDLGPFGPLFVMPRE